MLCLHVNSYTYMIWSVNKLHMIQQCICHDLWKRGKHGWRQFWYESKPHYVLESFWKEKGSIEFDLVIRVKFWSYKMSEVSQVYFYTLNSKKYLWDFKLYQCTFLWKKMNNLKILNEWDKCLTICQKPILRNKQDNKVAKFPKNVSIALHSIDLEK